MWHRLIQLITSLPRMQRSTLPKPTFEAWEEHLNNYRNTTG